MQVTPNIKQVSVRKFAQSAFAENSVIRNDGYRSYIPVRNVSGRYGYRVRQLHRTYNNKVVLSRLESSFRTC